MPRYFFHVVAAGEGIADEVGRVLPGIRAAHVRAVKFMEQVLPLIDREDDLREWRIEVADESGAVLITVLFRAAGLTGRTPSLPTTQWGGSHVPRDAPMTFLA